ncbi:peptide chain release factor N(5)-glutamine methyltransferase [Rhodopila sp.]|uniref:peptide chain release factor N(5)-glutamine methyltransferase n=1 Tax=Rhodopila sp. TaxID=2480087 RepID=UPI003D14878B
MMLSTIAEAVQHGAARLAPIADNPRLEARLLLAHALGLARNDLIRDPRKVVETNSYDRLLARREAREPIALILGHREFWSMDFQVSPATLIPRADTETLITAALKVFAHRTPPQVILDLGTGTGCLLLALLREYPGAFGIGVDIAPKAAALAKRNANRLGLAGRSAFVCGNWTSAIDGRFDLIVSNPPYIARKQVAELMPEVALYEPRLALEGGADGYDAYRTLMPRLRQALASGGAAILELGVGQADVMRVLARSHGFRVEFWTDLGGIVRACVLTLGPA